MSPKTSPSSKSDRASVDNENVAKRLWPEIFLIIFRCLVLNHKNGMHDSNNSGNKKSGRCFKTKKLYWNEDLELSGNPRVQKKRNICKATIIGVRNDYIQTDKLYVLKNPTEFWCKIKNLVQRKANRFISNGEIIRNQSMVFDYNCDVDIKS